MKSIIRLALCLLLCLGLGFLGGRLTRPEIATWYASLAKPWWTPPEWVFGVVWPTLYASMGVSLWLLWEARQAPDRGLAVALFMAQLALNATWTPIFFTWHQPVAALLVVAGLTLVLGATVGAAWRVRRLAAWLLAPYLIWTMYATALNAAIVALNP